MAGKRLLGALYWELEARTVGLERDLKGAEKSFGNLTKFIERNPMEAAGALGAALLAIGVKATLAAAEVDKSMRKIEGSVPGAMGAVAGLRKEIDQMVGPHSMAQLAAAAAAIAKLGVGSTAEVGQRLRAATLAADATGGDLTATIEGLDQVLDLFKMSSEEATAALAALFAAARGKNSMEDMFAALQGATPAIQDLGLSFDTATRALSSLIDSGMTAKQAGSELAQFGKNGKDGAASIQALADAAPAATDGLEKLAAAAKKNNESLDVQATAARNELNKSFVELGNITLPVVSSAMAAFVTNLRAMLNPLDAMHAAVKGIREEGEAIGGGAFVGPIRGSLPGMTSTGSHVETAQEQADRIKKQDDANKAHQKEWDAAVAKMEKDLDDYAADVAKAIQAQNALVDQMTDVVARSTSTMVDDLAIAFGRAKSEAVRTFGSEGAIVQEVKDGLAVMENAIGKALRAEAPLLVKMGAGVTSGIDLKPGKAGSGSSPADPGANLEHLRDQARYIQDAVQGALQLASAFGLVSEETAKVLAAIGQVASGIGPMVASIKALQAARESGTGGLAAFGGVIGSALPVVGGIATIVSSFLGASRAQKEAAEAMREAAKEALEAGRAALQHGGLATGGLYARIAGATGNPDADRIGMSVQQAAEVLAAQQALADAEEQRLKSAAKVAELEKAARDGATIGIRQQALAQLAIAKTQLAIDAQIQKNAEEYLALLGTTQEAERKAFDDRIQEGKDAAAKQLAADAEVAAQRARDAADEMEREAAAEAQKVADAAAEAARQAEAVARAKELADRDQQGFKWATEARLWMSLGFRDQAEQAQQLADQRQRHQEAVDKGYDAATIAALEYADSLDRSALAAHQAARAIDDAFSTLQMQFDVLGTDVASQFSEVENLTGLHGTRDQIAGLYNKGTNITPEQSEQNKNIARWLQYYDKANAPKSSGPSSFDSGGGGGSSGSTRGSDYSRGLTDVTAQGMMDIQRSQLYRLTQIADAVKLMADLASHSSAIAPPYLAGAVGGGPVTVNQRWTINVSVGGAGLGDPAGQGAAIASAVRRELGRVMDEELYRRFVGKARIVGDITVEQ